MIHLMKIAEWEYAGIKVQGLSLAGVHTSIILPQFSLCFDVAQGLPHAIPMNTFLISHGHLDHAAGIPYIISQKSMNSHKPPIFIMPEPLVSPLAEIMRQWSKIVGHDYEFHFKGTFPGEEIPLNSTHSVRVFTTLHGISSQGYSLCRRRRKLKEEFKEASSDEIKSLKERGEDPTEEKIDVLVSFTGDTQIEFLDQSPEVRESKILIMEATYLDEKKSVTSAKEWGHTHLSEIIPRLSTIHSERILLIHSSARYSFEEAQRILKDRLPPQEWERVVLFPGR
jgi:ribonuclease Z